MGSSSSPHRLSSARTITKKGGGISAAIINPAAAQREVCCGSETDLRTNIYLHGCRLGLRKCNLPTLVLATSFVEAAYHFPHLGSRQKAPRLPPMPRGLSYALSSWFQKAPKGNGSLL